jgi:hypothetical protein
MEPSKRKAFLLQDLDRYLGLWSRVERRSLACWVLTVADPTRLPKGSGTPLFRASAEESTIRLQNSPLSRLVSALNFSPVASAPAPIVIDETGFTGPVDLLLRSSLHDLPTLAAECNKYGLELRPAVRTLEVFVLSAQPISSTSIPLKPSNTKQ